MRRLSRPRKPAAWFRSGLLALASTCLVVLALAPAASADQTRSLIASFGPDGTPSTSFGNLRQLAFDQAQQRLYVLNVSPVAERAINGFDVSAAGVYAPLAGGFPIGVAAAGASPGISADNTTLGSAGNIYFLSESSGLYGFDATGVALGAGFPVSSFGDPCGVAVDPAGSVWVGDYNTKSVKAFSASGVPLSTVDTSAEGNPCHVSFDANGDMYVAMYNGPVWKYTAPGYTRATKVDSGPTRALTVDRTTHDLYVVHAGDVMAYDSTGSELYRFADGIAGASLQGVAVDQASNQVYVSDSGNKLVHAFGAAFEVPAPGASMLPASTIGTTTATFNATITPPGGFDTTYHFEYSDNGTIWNRVPSNEVDVGSDHQAVTVHQDVTGLSPNTVYQVRIVATTGTPTTSAPATFTTLKTPPSISGTTATPVTQTTARLTGYITPNNQATTYHFEWGPTTDYGHQAPDLEAYTGSGSDPVRVGANISGLAPGATYYFRIVATSPSGTTKGPDRAFSTLGTNGLPSGRAYELVSPADKGAGGYVGSIPFFNNTIRFQAAPGGQHVIYGMTAYGLPDATVGGPVNFLANRGGSGWSSTQSFPPTLIPPYQYGNSNITSVAVYYAPDLSCGLFTSYEPLTSDTPQAVIDAGKASLYRQSADGTYTLLTPKVPTNVASVSPQLPGAYTVVGVSSDCSRIVFQTPFTYPDVGASGLYEWSDGTLRNVGVLPDGTVASGATAGYSGGSTGNSSAWNAVSPDASSIFFSARSNAGGDSGNTALFLRRDGQSTIDVSQSETATVNRGAMFQLASKTGDRVLFLANYGLTSTSSAGPTTADCTMSQAACDLYEYDVSNGGLTDLSADSDAANTNGATVAGVLGASDDASYVYFAAQGQLVPGKGSSYVANVAASTYNVYLTHDGDLGYVGRLNKADLVSDPAGALITGSTGAGATWRSRVTPDGRHLLFSSTANVIGYDSGGVAEAYRYSAGSDATVCVSCRPDGLPSVGTSTGAFGDRTAPLPSGTNTVNPLSPPDTLTDDGSRVFFTMPDVLASGAVEGNANVYEWHDGQVYLLATGTAPSTVTGQVRSGLELQGATADGDDVFITTGEQLVPEDTDLRYDLYDLRVGGGFRTPPAPPAPCEPLGDSACAGPLVAPPEFAPVGSAAFSGAGNVPPPPAPQSKPQPKAKQLRVSKPKTVHGTSTRIKVKVPAKGKIRISGSGLKRSYRTAKRAGGTYRVAVRLSERARRTLRRKHRVRVRVTVRFTPKHGKRQRERVHVTFKPKTAKRHGSKGTRRSVGLSRGTTVAVDAHGKVR